MDKQERMQLFEKIDRAEVVSFDIFDTLLFRKTNTPEGVFDLVGKHFQIHGFRKLRMDAQNEASRIVFQRHQYPHADMNDIYEVLGRHDEIPVDWQAVKLFEIQTERDALVANQEMLEVFQYAKQKGKRVVATSDMYLLAETLKEFLEHNGFVGFDYIYCSADEHKAKFNRDLFEHVAQCENVPFESILHIGDKERDDVEFPSAYGMDAFLYCRTVDLAPSRMAAGSDIDVGLYKILGNRERGFWYNLGVRVGGPLYMGLYQFIRNEIESSGKKVFFLARDGYNLYQLFRNNGYENVEYLYTSRRAMTLASIGELNEQEIETLPPYTYGQTVGEILDYLQVERDSIMHLKEAGFDSFENIIHTEKDRKAFRRLYSLDKDVFLERCRKERENALAYLNRIGFLDQDAICFDCGWQGSSQDLIERFKKISGFDHIRHEFLYFGIRNGDKSRKQLHNRHYRTYLFDFYKNFEIQNDVAQNVVLYELFFSAPHESLYYYDDGGKLVFEGNAESKDKDALLEGIGDFIRMGLKFADDYQIEFRPEISIAQLKRLIHRPTEEEAVTIGDLCNIDGFVKTQNADKYIAYLTEEQLENGLKDDSLYWLDGLLTRPDISEHVKKKVANLYGRTYPEQIPEYHLEDRSSICNYHRWRANCTEMAVHLDVAEQTVKFSVVIPVYNTVTEQLKACIDAVLNQTYSNYELILVDDHSSWDTVVPVLKSYEDDSKVRVIYRETNGHISVATNDGIGIAQGDFIVFMDCDDTIECEALMEFAKKLNENPELDFIYSDEDKITEDGKIHHMPFMKPDWSPDLFLNMMYTNHLATYRTSIVRMVGGLRTAYNGSQDYDFTLRFMEKSSNERVGHIPQILYHWRERKESVAFAMNSKNYASEAARFAKEDYIRRNGINAKLEYIPGMSQYRIVYDVVGDPCVSIVIPSKDHPDVLKQCIESICSFTNYRNYEIIVVDNGSSEKNRNVISDYLEQVGATYLYQQEKFNFSRMCNRGAKAAKGEYLLFLNDDVEVFQPDWLERMLGHAQRPHTGAVGAKLYYPLSTKIQHTGCANLYKEGPVHNFMTLDDQYPYYFGWNRVDVNCCMVTGACLLVNSEKYWSVGGFDESFPVAYNDAKLCFDLLKKGYYHVVRNDVAAYHYESLSRGTDQEDEEKLLRLHGEKAALYAVCPEMNGRDPFRNPNIHRFDASLKLHNAYDKLIPTDVEGAIITANGSVDSVDVTEYIRIIGWSLPEGTGQTKRYVVAKDPYGRVYSAPVCKMERADVAEHFNDPQYLYSGFECVLRPEDLRMDIMSYTLGTMTVDQNDQKYIHWCTSSPVIRQSKPRGMDLGTKEMGQAKIMDRSSECAWYLDSCVHNKNYHRICGFAFKRGNEHDQYRTTLLLVEEGGQTICCTPQKDERIDVACAFPQEHFLLNTGFVCYVFDSLLKSNGRYRLIIRLTNQFYPEDVLDIPTQAFIALQ